MIESARDNTSRLGPLGTISLHVGAAIAALAAVDSVDGLPFHMPLGWTNNLLLWFLIGVTLAALGIIWMRQSEPPQTDDEHFLED